MKRTSAFAVALFALLVPAFLRAQQSSISGVILTDEADGRPIARAVVTLNGARLRPSLVATTDAAGRFSFSNLPAGQFTLSASKPTYLTMAYGQATPGRGAGMPISLQASQQLTGLTWKLPRGAVISGTVLDDSRRPMRDVPIVLMQYRMVNDERTLGAASCCVWPITDSTGAYRVSGVLPGDYLVSAIPPGAYVYIPSGPWSGSSAEVRAIDPAETQWALRLIADANGGGRGAQAPLAEPPPGRPVSYGRVYFPNTIDERTATVITVRAGEERPGIDLQMRLERTARIEGRVVGPDGQTPAGLIRISHAGATTGGGANPGRFSYRNQLPGHHVITARAGALWGSIDVDLNGQDVTDLVLSLQPSTTLTGRVVFESSGTAAPQDPTRVRIALRPLLVGTPAVNAIADGTFTIAGVDPGHYRMNATIVAPAGTPAGTGGGSSWALKSAMLNGRDIADAPFDAKPGENISDVIVTLTDRATELSGTLLDANDQPAPGYYVVLFSTDPAFWAQGSRRVPAPARASTDGTFRFVGLPAGTYYIAAMTMADAADLADAAFLKTLSASATTVTLAESEKKVQALKFRAR